MGLHQITDFLRPVGRGLKSAGRYILNPDDEEENDEPIDVAQDPQGGVFGRLSRGSIGRIGSGGLFSGQDPNNPNIMHLTGDGDTFKRVNGFAPQDQSTIAQPLEQTRGPYVPPSAEEAPIMPRSQSTFASVDANEVLTRPKTADESQPINRNSSLDFSRNAPQFEPIQLDKMPIEARQAQARGTKPVYKDTGNPREDTTRYEQELLNWRNPLDRNGRLKSGAKMALQGFARGVASTGSIAGGIGGAAAGFGYGAIQPNVDERQWRDEEAARTGQRRQAFDAIQTKDLQRRKLEGEIGETAARTNDILNPREKPLTPHYETRDDGTYVVDAQSPNGRKLSGVPGRARPSSAKYEWRDGVLNRFDDKGVPHPVLGEDGKPWTDQSKVPRKITVNGETFNVSEGEAARIMGGIESADRAAGNKAGELDANAAADEENADRIEGRAVATENAATLLEQEIKRDEAALDPKVWTYEADKRAVEAKKERLTRVREKAQEERDEAGKLRTGAKAKRASAPKGRQARSRTNGPTGNDNAVTTKSKFAETKKKYGM